MQGWVEWDQVSAAGSGGEDQVGEGDVFEVGGGGLGRGDAVVVLEEAGEGFLVVGVDVGDDPLTALFVVLHSGYRPTDGQLECWMRCNVHGEN